MVEGSGEGENSEHYVRKLRNECFRAHRTVGTIVILPPLPQVPILKVYVSHLVLGGLSALIHRAQDSPAAVAERM